MPIVSNIEKINESFQIPICFNEKKIELNKNIITDLELIDTIDASCNPIYSYVFQPNTCFGKKVVRQFSEYYTTDTEFLKETQELLKNYKKLELTNDETSESKDKYFTGILDIWDEIKNDIGFKDRYHYVDVPMLEFLNQYSPFLQIMSIYNLASPVLSLFVPFIILLIPFLIIKMKGMTITFHEYVEVLKVIASNHAIGRLFTEFSEVNLNEKIYLLISAGFYIFSIYQNVMTCIKFNKNMIKIHSHIKSIKEYIEYSICKMNNLLIFTEKLKTYQSFNHTMREKMVELTKIKEELAKVSEYKLNLKKLGELGVILKSFYTLYNNQDLNNHILYTFGINGYIDNLEGIVANVTTKKMNHVKFDKKKSKSNMKNLYYPVNENPIKNTVKMKKNLIITGPNASGKTTILKTVLINVILSQQMGCGFYDSATLSPYKYIHCYLNIPDTSGRDSLFQAEARRCKEILDLIKMNPKENHFCVFDELYSGTNPDEAVRSALAFMNYLIKTQSIYCILTTHFIKLCEYLDKNNKIENFYMETEYLDDGENNGIENFKYKYILKKGISNVRGGIKVLYDMDYPSEIIEESRKI
jgi:hypothetical protein